MIQTRMHLISHYPGKPRDVSYHWGSWIPIPGEQSGHVKHMMERFKTREIKWYCLFMQSLNTDDGSMEFQVVDHNGHEDVPPLELNVAAKGFVPPPEAPKKQKAVGGFGIPPSFFQEMSPNKAAIKKSKYDQVVVIPPQPIPEDGGF